MSAVVQGIPGEAALFAVRKQANSQRDAGQPISDGHLGRNYLKGRHGDHANPVLTAAGYNLRLVLRWLGTRLAKFLIATLDTLRPNLPFNPTS